VSAILLDEHPAGGRPDRVQRRPSDRWHPHSACPTLSLASRGRAIISLPSLVEHDAVPFESREMVRGCSSGANVVAADGSTVHDGEPFIFEMTPRSSMAMLAPLVAVEEVNSHWRRRCTQCSGRRPDPGFVEVDGGGRLAVLSRSVPEEPEATSCS